MAAGSTGKAPSKRKRAVAPDVETAGNALLAIGDIEAADGDLEGKRRRGAAGIQGQAIGSPLRDLPADAGLVERWNELYKVSLPRAAKSKHPAQQRWPVNLDHCFARIILDNTLSASLGRERPWTALIKAPAYKNMSAAQLQAAINLGEQILEGKASLIELDERSLMLRGKQPKHSK